MRQILGWGLGLLAVLMGVLLVAVFWLRTSLPQTDGSLPLPGLGAAVEVLRDERGIPTIRAADMADAVMALGYVHAQDRLWQMDAMRRTAAGRLSELAGTVTIRLDRLMRILGFAQQATAMADNLPDEVIRLLKAYSEGVNAYIRAPNGPLPPEFQLLRYEPEPWEPRHSLLWGRLMALQLSGNWRSELLRAALPESLGPEQRAFLWEGYPPEAPTTLGSAELRAGLAELPLLELADLLPWELRPKSASNWWAVDAAHSGTGGAILANDPHLGLSAPGTWYLARIETPELTLAGATAPGVPFMVIGHNDHIAWGLTTTHSDTQDIFVERLAEDGEAYITPDGPQPFESREESIALRDGESETLRIRITRHGPVISDSLSEARDLTPAGHVLALAWSALSKKDAGAEALYRLNRAKDVDQGLAALRLWRSPQQNVLLADRAGRIAFAAPADVPVRAAGDGTQPAPGWNGDYDWTGMLPFEELPRIVDPPAGRLVNANNKIVPEGYPHLIAEHWPSPERAIRIEAMLNVRPLTLERAEEMQLDVLSLGAQALLPRLLDLLPPASLEDPTAAAARDLLADWDGEMAANLAAPAIYTAWTVMLTRRLLADDLGAAFSGFARPSARLLGRILSEGQEWCDDRNTPGSETCPEQLAAALSDALALLAQRLGGEPGSWRWGELHRARFDHPIFAHVPLVGRLTAYDVATSGGDETVNRGGMIVDNPERLFEHNHGPGLRAVFDLDDPDRSRFMIATGQSGNPFSDSYGSLATEWRDGKYVTLTAPEDPAHRLRLVPE